MNGRTRWAVVLCVVGSLGRAAAAEAQLLGPTPDPAEPDLTVINLSTTGQIPPGKLVFRLTHRFSRPLDGFSNNFSFGDLLGDFFGFDSAARIGFELRVGLMTGTHIGISPYQRQDHRDLRTAGACPPRRREPGRHRRSGERRGTGQLS